ncbi:MAG: Na+/H+ antiporter [Acetobacter sp.]|nr:Na+/H+ antiporter [Acetobacter sp.]
MFTIKITLLLLWLAALSSILARASRQKIPQPLILILLGSLAALFGFHIQLHPELFMFLFLPPLLFVDAFHMPLREFKQLRGPILFLAFGLVVLNTIACGYLIHWILPNLLLSVCFTLAAALSPTDTVAVSSLIEGKPVPSRLLQILSGEALFNDASGLVCFRFATTDALIGEFSYQHAFNSFLFVALGGITIGAVLAWLAARTDYVLIRHGFDEAQSQILLVLLLPFLLYAVAEAVECSGILAAVSGCIVLKLSGVVEESAITTRIQANTVWNVVSYTFNALIFLFLGFQLPSLLQQAYHVVHVHNTTLWRMTLVVFMIYGIMFCIRLLGVWASAFLRWFVARLRHTEFEPLSFPASLLLTFAGVRGAVTLAAVLSLPTGLDGTQIFPSRETVIVIATGVIILSLLLASGAIPFCLRFIPPELISKSAQEENDARRKLLNAALTVLSKAHDGIFPPLGKRETILSEEEKLMRLESTERLQRLYKSRLETEDIAFIDGVVHGSNALRRARFELALRLQILRVQRQNMRDMMTKGEINDQTEWKLQEEIDYEEQVIRSQIRHLPRESKSA